MKSACVELEVLYSHTDEIQAIVDHIVIYLKLITFFLSLPFIAQLVIIFESDDKYDRTVFGQSQKGGVCISWLHEEESGRNSLHIHYDQVVHNCPRIVRV